ncbi:MAG TPA: enoyl-CoA hydratase/isomerase family protein, partial [Solirubrobacterales bacterium]|nr:enoyl-CoA hydratase/isomerase family protein [Solirubrobacterales bacterium]
MSTETLSSSPPELNTLRIEIDGKIGMLTLDRPDAFNAMSPEMIGELTVAFAWLADRAPLRALIITGAGKAFCAGGDVNWFQRGVSDDEIDLPSEVRRGAEALHAAIVDLRRIPYPVVCAVNGPAAGAGFSLALACDIRIASEAAFFACAYGRIGASPDGGMTYFLPRVVGPSRALELLLNDPNMKPEDALNEGLVSEVVPPDELLDRARGEAEKLAAKAPYYVKMAKKLVGVSIEN